MAAGIRHHTQADGTFSATGDTAWEENHDIEEAGGQALTVGAIAANQYLQRVGTEIVGAAAPGSDIVASGAPNQDFDLTNAGGGGAVTIISKSVAGIVATDQIQIEIWATILNNSGGTKTYSPSVACGALSIPVTEGATVAASATSRAVRRWTANFSVSAADLALGMLSGLGSAIVAVDTHGNAVLTVSSQAWDTLAGDLTGTQTVSFTVTSSAANTTQTLTLHSYTIRKISAV